MATFTSTTLSPYGEHGMQISNVTTETGDAVEIQADTCSPFGLQDFQDNKKFSLTLNAEKGSKLHEFASSIDKWIDTWMDNHSDAIGMNDRSQKGIIKDLNYSPCLKQSKGDYADSVKVKVPSYQDSGEMKFVSRFFCLEQIKAGGKVGPLPTEEVMRRLSSSADLTVLIQFYGVWVGNNKKFGPVMRLIQAAVPEAQQADDDMLKMDIS